MCAGRVQAALTRCPLAPWLPRSLNPEVAAPLPRLTCLRRLVLDGNQADDAAAAHAAALPQLRCVGGCAGAAWPGELCLLCFHPSVLLSPGGVEDCTALRSTSCRELSLRSSEHLTDAGLRELARLRGSTQLARSSSMDGGEPSDTVAAGSSSSGTSGSGSGSGRDAGLASLDISGCSGLTDGCWVAITEVRRDGM